MIRVLVNGADGRMGSQVVKAVVADNELELVGGVSISHIGEQAELTRVFATWPSSRTTTNALHPSATHNEVR